MHICLIKIVFIPRRRFYYIRQNHWKCHVEQDLCLLLRKIKRIKGIYTALHANFRNDHLQVILINLKVKVSQETKRNRILCRVCVMVIQWGFVPSNLTNWMRVRRYFQSLVNVSTYEKSNVNILGWWSTKQFLIVYEARSFFIVCWGSIYRREAAEWYLNGQSHRLNKRFSFCHEMRSTRQCNFLLW